MQKNSEPVIIFNLFQEHLKNIHDKNPIKFTTPTADGQLQAALDFQT